MVQYCNWLGLAVSGLSLTLLNVDKLIYFNWPYLYEQKVTKRKAIFLCISVWIVSLGFEILGIGLKFVVFVSFVSYVWIQNIVFVTADCMLQVN